MEGNKRVVEIECSVVAEWLFAAYFRQAVYYDDITLTNDINQKVNNGVLVANPNVAYRGFVLPGGSRSTKTTSICQFLLDYCQRNRNKKKDILIARQQYSDLKDSVMKDFFDFLTLHGFYRDNMHLKSNPQKYVLHGNTIHFSGLDSSGAHGKKYDVVWINEAFEAEKDAFDQLEMRLTEFFIFDYNPCFTDHWILRSVVTRPNVWLSPISTWRHNRWLQQGIIDKIKSYDPSNPENIRNGTADDYMHQVYALGYGAQPEGVIFKYVDWITAEEFPKNLDWWLALDFGFQNDPCAMVKVAISGSDLYLQEMCYEPIETPLLISEMLRGKGIEKFRPIIADSSDKYISAKYGSFEMVKDLCRFGWNVSKVKKTNDIVYWLSKMHEYTMHIVASDHFKTEIQNYRWRTINGIQVSQPMDKWNHLIDASRYGVMMRANTRRTRFRNND